MRTNNKNKPQKMKTGTKILAALFIVSVAMNVCLLQRGPVTETRIERDTVWRDTIINHPEPAEAKATGDTIYVKVPYTLAADTIHDSIAVALPVEQKRYEDSLYTAWVSGYRPALDSIRLSLPEITTTITKTIVKPSPRLSVGVQLGAGLGVFSRQPDIYAGVGVSWRLFGDK